jgi:uncharacterized protein (DUF362 family)
MRSHALHSRRTFFRNSFLAGLAVATSGPLTSAARAATGATAPKTRTAVALTTGTDRAAMVFDGLKPFARQIQQAIAGKQVVLKPNNVSIDVPLCATHADCLQGILEFLKSIGRTDNIIIAESAAGGPTLEGFANYGYTRLTGSYGVKLVDLDQEPIRLLHVFDEKDFRPHAVRMSRVLLDPRAYIISATRFKTHDRVVATLSLKNIIVGAPIKDPGFRWGPASRAGAKNDKPLIHGSGFRGINYNLFAVAQQLHPHLSVLDGVEGMQGDGPVGGQLMDHRVCVVSPDWLAADRVAVELMGIDFATVGYLNYCGQANLGQTDLAQIDVLGPALKDHIKPYKLNANIADQLVWMRA